MRFSAATASKPPLLTLPNELFFEVASHLESFQDFNSFLRTTPAFHTIFNTHPDRRAVAADELVREDIVKWVLRQYRIAPLTLLLDNGLSVHQKLGQHSKQLLPWVCCHCSDGKLSVSLAELLIGTGADVTEKDPIYLLREKIDC
jgi:hypothetical protein